MPSAALNILAFAGAAIANPWHGQNHQHMHHPKHYSPSSSSSDSSAAPYPIANGTQPIFNPTAGGSVTSTSTSTNYVTITSTLNLASSYSSGYSTADGTGLSSAESSSSICTSDVTVTTKIYETVTVTPSSSVAGPTETSSSSSSSSPSSSPKKTSTIYQTSTIPSGPSAYSSASSSSSVSSSEASPVPITSSSSSSEASSSVEPTSAPSLSLTYSDVNKAPTYAAPPSYSAPSSSSSSVYVAPTTTSAASSYSAPASSSSSSAAATTYASSSSGGKRGVAYNDASLTDCFADSPHFGWAYNWGSATSGLNSAFKYIPMLWGPSSDFTSYWDVNAEAALAAGADTFFSFNEPDLSSQSNLSPEDAADAYRTYMMPYADRVKLCAPSVTNGGGAMGLTWLSNFMAACSDCQIDCINVHWYEDASLTDYFQQQVQNATDISGGKPVYVSEFGTTGGDTSSFLQTVMPWMDSQDFVVGYSYFMVSNGLLVDGAEPSNYGLTYKNYS